MNKRIHSISGFLRFLKAAGICFMLNAKDKTAIGIKRKNASEETFEKREKIWAYTVRKTSPVKMYEERYRIS